MGKCIVSFDEIEILNKKSDTPHSDNDWMVITWFDNGTVVRTDKSPLVNAAGSTVLDSGNALAPFSSEVNCADGDLVSASFVVMNLGSYDPSQQVDAVGRVAEDLAKAVADAYAKAAEFVVRNSGIPLGSVFADGIHAVAPAFVDSVGAAFEDVIIPFAEDIAATLAQVLGRPNCNGPVFYDTVVFQPFEPKTDVPIARVYTASSLSGCGSPARTSVHLTQERVLDEVFQFPTTPAPSVDVTPTTQSNPDAWLGTWAEDSSTPTPIVTVTIARSMRASGTLSVTIKEVVDRRFQAEFDATADPISPHPDRVFVYVGNVFGQVRPWISHPHSPQDMLRVHILGLTGAGTSAGAVGMGSAGPAANRLETGGQVRRVTFSLPWSRPETAGIPVTTAAGTSVAGRVGVPSETPAFLDAADTIRLPDQGVTLALYSFQHQGQFIGHGVRYIRDENLSYTRADVMLAPWDPIH